MKYFPLLIIISILCPWTLTAQQNFWEQTSGPAGGNFQPYASAMNSSGDIFCSSLNPGYVYRSTDHGESWAELKNGLPTGGEFISLAVNRKNYIFTGAWWGQGIYRSSDNGETWIRTSFPYHFPNRMAIDSSGALLVLTYHDGAGIIRSSDDGDTWSQVGPVSGIEMKSIAVNKSGHIYASTSAELFRSTDNGTTWSSAGLHHSSEGIAFNSQGHIFCIRSWSYGAQSLFVSTNDGTSWDSIINCPPARDGMSYNGISIDSKNNIYIAGSWGSHRSTDGGETWADIGDYQCRGFLFDKKNHVLMFTTNVGILHSTDHGDHWQFTGPAISHVKSLSVSSSGIALAGLDYFRGSDDAGLTYSTNGCTSWVPVGGYTLLIQCVLAGEKDTSLLGTDIGIYLLTDSGTNWVATGLPNTSVLCMERSTSGSIFAGTGGGGLYRSTDDGVSWSYVGLMNTNIRSVFTYNTDTIFVGIENGGIYRSTDDGASWAFLGLPGTTVVALTRGKMNGLLVATSSGVYRSTDGGTSWSFAGLNGRDIRDLISSSSGDIYAATGDSGVYLSSNNGQNWSAIISGLDHLNVTSLVIDHDGYLYAGTDGGGVYKSTNIVVGVKEHVATVPEVHQVFQNYPNPFNPVTTITYTLPASGYVTLSVFNMLGQEITVLVHDVQEPGYKTVSFDASNLPSGVYTYRITAGTFTDFKKMLLLR